VTRSAYTREDFLMTRPTKSPSRETGYAETVRALVDRDGMVCFLCGHKHATVHTMQADLLNHSKPFALENLVVSCKPCAKRRNGKPVAAYWRERLSAAAAEQAHIEMMGRSRDVVMSLRLAAMPFTVKAPFHIGKHGGLYRKEEDEDGNLMDVEVLSP